MRIEYHRTLIADRVRNLALKKALEAVIIPGVTTVADIGAGTGLIGLMAEQLGAREVYLYECAGVAGVCARVLKSNKTRRCRLFPCHSTEMIDPPRADVVVSETLGNYALEENIIATLDDARARHLKPGGTLVPGRIAQFVVPVIGDRVARELAVWGQAGAGLGLDLDFAPARSMSANNVYVRSFSRNELLQAEGTQWDTIDLTRSAKSNRKGEAAWTMARGSTIQGIAYWWAATLVPGIELSTSPFAPATHWEQLYFPLAMPMRVEAKETMRLALRSRSSDAEGTHLAWTATRETSSGKTLERQAMDLDKGYLP